MMAWARVACARMAAHTRTAALGARAAMMARAVVAATTVAMAMAIAPAGALGSQKVHLYASFSPNRPGASTTITFGFNVTSPDQLAPSPLLGVDLHLPAGIGLGHTTLGTAICNPVYLYAYGPKGCPANSRLGYGTALAEVPYGPEVVQEEASVNAYRGEPVEERTTILFFAEGWTPVFADLVFPGQLLEDSGPFGGRIDTNVPPVPSLPGGPNVSVVRFQSTFGPKHLIYNRTIHGRRIHFAPRGVTVPFTCPRGGYPFAADFTFEDGTNITAHASAPCGRAARGRGRRSG